MAHTAALVRAYVASKVHVKILVCIDSKKFVGVLDWEEMQAELVHACGW
jgi:hypothetical protein